MWFWEWASLPLSVLLSLCIIFAAYKSCPVLAVTHSCPPFDFWFSWPCQVLRAFQVTLWSKALWFSVGRFSLKSIRFLIFFKIGVELFYNVMLVHSIQQSESGIYILMSSTSWASLPPPHPTLLDHKTEDLEWTDSSGLSAWSFPNHYTDKQCCTWLLWCHRLCGFPRSYGRHIEI